MHIFGHESLQLFGDNDYHVFPSLIFNDFEGSFSYLDGTPEDKQKC